MARDFLGRAVTSNGGGKQRGAAGNAFELEAELSTLNDKIVDARTNMARQIASYCLQSSTGDPMQLKRTIIKTLNALNISDADRCEILVHALGLVSVNR